MKALPEPNLKQANQSSQACQAGSAANVRAIQDIRGWDADELLPWIQQKLYIPLKPKDVERFSNAEIDGEVFLRHPGDRMFFVSAGFSFGVSDKLADLAEITRKKSKYSHLYHGYYANS